MSQEAGPLDTSDSRREASVAVARRAAAAHEWRRQNGVIFWTASSVCLAISLPLTFFLPESWTRDFGPLSPFVGVMMMIVPSIAKVAAVSLFKGVTKTFLAIVWAFTLATSVALACRRYPLDIRSGIPKQGRWTVFWLAAFIVVAFCLFQFVGFTVTAGMLAGDSLGAIVARAIATSRFWLAFFGTALYVLIPILTTVAVVVGRNFKRLWLTDLPTSD